MLMQADEITDWEGIDAWLDSRPKAAMRMEQSVLLWRIASRELPFTLEPSEQNPDQFSATQHTFFVLLASAFARYTALNHNGVPSRNALGLSIDSRGGHSGIGSVQAAAIAVGVSLGTTWASTSGIASSINRHSLIQFGHPGYAESNPTYLARTIAALLAIKSDCKLIEEKGWKTLAKGPLWLQDDICPPFWSERMAMFGSGYMIASFSVAALPKMRKGSTSMKL
jgi:hypothetical protein